jgi:hypothetical protein
MGIRRKYCAAVTAGLVLAGTAITAFAPAASAHSKGLTSSQIKALTKELGGDKHLTYEATYKTVGTGSSATVTIAQSPPKSNFSSGGGAVIDTGTKTYFCSTSSGNPTCLSAGGSNPLAALEDFFSPTAALEALSEAKAGLGSKLLNIKTVSSSQTIAGQPSTCVTVNVSGHGGKYCVTKKGILSYAGETSGSYFELTKFSTSPASSLFTLPAGATVETLPTGVTLPGGESIP